MTMTEWYLTGCTVTAMMMLCLLRRHRLSFIFAACLAAFWPLIGMLWLVMRIIRVLTPPHEHKLLLVCSAGGHLLEMCMLKEPVWQQYERAWVCLRKIDSETLLAGETVHYAYGPTNRNFINLVRNLIFAIGVMGHERPSIIISTGAGVAVPFLITGWLYGARTLHIETFARTKGMTLSGKLVYPFVTDFLVQSPHVAQFYPQAVFKGTVF